jgi:hypothetical protein
MVHIALKCPQEPPAVEVHTALIALQCLPMTQIYAQLFNKCY